LESIDYIDIIIANAGIAYIYPKVWEVKTEDMQRHIIPNVYGNIWLYQAVLPLLKKAGRRCGLVLDLVQRTLRLVISVSHSIGLG
jgi:NAD(P)-dependent dehydrogenase (short-subunit alcohol dehydrogenase family)